MGKWRVAVTYTAADGSTQSDVLSRYFESEEEAARAYNRRARKLLGAQALLNAVAEQKRKPGPGHIGFQFPCMYFGVRWFSKGRRHWRAYGHVPGTCKELSVGHHMTEEAAAQAYNARALEVIGPHAPLNDAPAAPPKPGQPRSAYRGVFWCSKRSRWRVQVPYKRLDGRMTSTSAGYHDREEAAAQAYNARALQVIGPNAPMNDVLPTPSAPPLPAMPKSAYRGVCWHNLTSKWRAQVQYKLSDGRRKYIWAGRHVSELAAAQAYNLRAQQLLGDEAQLNNLSHHHGGEKFLPPKRKYGYRGVTWGAEKRRWCAWVHYNEAGQNLQVYAGAFRDVHEAARAYNVQALQLLGDKAQLNDVPGGV